MFLEGKNPDAALKDAAAAVTAAIADYNQRVPAG
jgi:hypothetical protein